MKKIFINVLRLVCILVLIFSFVAVLSSPSHIYAITSYYWVGNSGNWGDSAHWATSSGGLGGSGLPGISDAAIFDNLSFNTSGQIVTVASSANIYSVNWSGVTNNPQWKFNNNIYVYGNITADPNMSVAHTGSNTIEMYSSSTNLNHLKTCGILFDVPIQCYSDYNVYLDDDLNVGTSTITCDAGSLITNSYNITCGAWTMSRAISPGTSTINASANFAGYGNTYNIVNLTGTTQTISGSNVFTTLSGVSTSAQTIKFTDTTTQTVTNLNLNGSAGNIHILRGSSTGGWTISKGGTGTVYLDYVNISYSTATQANTFFAGINSNNISNNTKWLFQRNITTISGSNGVVSPSDSVYTYNQSQVVNISATPNACYHFVNWTGTATGVADTGASSTTITVNNSGTVQGNFAINQYTLTYNAGSGGSIVGTTPQTINCGSDGTQVTASPDPNYVFVNWSDAVETAARTDTNIQANLSVTANFKLNMYWLNYSSGSHGSLSGNTSQYVLAGSDGTAVDAIPDPCYHFVNWNDSVTSDPRTDTSISGDIDVLANFAINTSTITYSHDANGTISGSDTQNINCGEYTSSVAAVPNSCYHFVNWDDLNTSISRTDLGISTNQTYTANFAVNTSTITYIAGSNGTLNNSTPQIINCGSDTIDVLAIPNTCYHFVDWSDASTDNPRHDTGTSINQSFTANFAITQYNLSLVSDNVSYGSPYFNGSSPFNCGMLVDIHGNASYGYYFGYWDPSSGITDPNSSDTTIYMSGDMNITSYYFMSLPDPPTNLSITQTGTDSIRISWNNGLYAINTIIIGNTSDYPDTISSLYEVYNGSGTYVDLNGLNLDQYAYYYRAWSQNPSGNSSTYSQIKTGGNGMEILAVIILLIFAALGSTFFAFRMRDILITVGAAVSWLSIMLFAFSSDKGFNMTNPWVWSFVLGLICIIVGILLVYMRREVDEYGRMVNREKDNRSESQISQMNHKRELRAMTSRYNKKKGWR